MKPGWKVKRLEEVLTLHYGKELPKEDRNSSGKFPVFGANGIKDYSDRHLVNGPSLIIGRKGSAGEIARSDGPFWPLDVAYFTSHNAEYLDFEYMGYLLKTLNLPSLAKGVKPGISRSDVYDISLSLPSLEEQQRIVVILNNAFAGIDNLYREYHAQLSNLEELRQSLLQKASTGELS